MALDSRNSCSLCHSDFEEVPQLSRAEALLAETAVEVVEVELAVEPLLQLASKRLHLAAVEVVAERRHPKVVDHHQEAVVPPVAAKALHQPFQLEVLALAAVAEALEAPSLQHANWEKADHPEVLPLRLQHL